MKVIKPSVEIVSKLPEGREILKHLEECGRICYKSEHLITEDSYIIFANKILKNKHESVLEHFSFTVKFICDRAISHEIVRHRIASYSQESTRYCNYSKNKFNSEITVIEPCFFVPGTESYNLWYNLCLSSERAYFNLLNIGNSPQAARSVLPNSLKTEINMTANIREWRHFLDLRCSQAAHPQIRELAVQLLRLLVKNIPIVFDDLFYKYCV